MSRRDIVALHRDMTGPLSRASLKLIDLVRAATRDSPQVNYSYWVKPVARDMMTTERSAGSARLVCDTVIGVDSAQQVNLSLRKSLLRGK